VAVRVWVPRLDGAVNVPERPVLPEGKVAIVVVPRATVTAPHVSQPPPKNCMACPGIAEAGESGPAIDTTSDGGPDGGPATTVNVARCGEQPGEVGLAVAMRV
jgi:hypothetical protein